MNLLYITYVSTGFYSSIIYDVTVLDFM